MYFTYKTCPFRWIRQLVITTRGSRYRLPTFIDSFTYICGFPHCIFLLLFNLQTNRQKFQPMCTVNTMEYRLNNTMNKIIVFHVYWIWNIGMDITHIWIQRAKLLQNLNEQASSIKCFCSISVKCKQDDKKEYLKQKGRYCIIELLTWLTGQLALIYLAYQPLQKHWEQILLHVDCLLDSIE